MNSDFIKRGIILPLVAALVAGVLGFFATSIGLDGITPFKSESRVLYFDETQPSNDLAIDLTALKKGDIAGVLNSKEEMALRYCTDYSNLLTEASLSDRGTYPDGIGTAYVEIINSNSSKFGEEVIFASASGECIYKKTDEKTLKSENDVFFISPRAEKSMVLYYRMRGEGGLSSKYKAIIYEEAE